MWHEPSEIILVFRFSAQLLSVINNVLLLSVLERVFADEYFEEAVFVCFSPWFFDQ